MSEAVTEVDCGRILTLQENLAQSRGASGIKTAAITCSDHSFLYIYYGVCVFIMDALS